MLNSPIPEVEEDNSKRAKINKSSRSPKKSKSKSRSPDSDGFGFSEFRRSRKLTSDALKQLVHASYVAGQESVEKQPIDSRRKVDFSDVDEIVVKEARAALTVEETKKISTRRMRKPRTNNK